MNQANQMLKAIREKKALITKAYEEAKEKLEEKYANDMAVLDKEEREWLKQFDDVPTDEII